MQFVDSSSCYVTKIVKCKTSLQCQCQKLLIKLSKVIYLDSIAYFNSSHCENKLCIIVYNIYSYTRYILILKNFLIVLLQKDVSFPIHFLQTSNKSWLLQLLFVTLFLLVIWKIQKQKTNRRCIKTVYKHLESAINFKISQSLNRCET